MREYDVSPSYEGHAASNDIKQNCLELATFSAHFCSSIMIDGNLFSDSNVTFNYEFRGRTNYYYYYYYYYYLPRYIQKCKRSQPVNLNNITVINTLSAVVITISVDVQILPTGEEFGGRGGHNPIVQYPDKGHRS